MKQKSSRKHLRPYKIDKKKKEHSTRSQNIKEKNEFDKFLSEGVGISDPQDMLGISQEQIASLYDEGMQYLMIHETGQATRVFQLLCSLCPYDPDCWFGLGKAMEAEGEYKRALSSFLMSETLNPAFLPAYEEAIICCLEMREYKEARHILARCKKQRSLFEEFFGITEVRHALDRIETEIVSAEHQVS